MRTTLALTFVLLAPAAARQAPEMVVGLPWLAERLGDPKVVVISTDGDAVFQHGHIPGARRMDHHDMIGGDHRLLEPTALAAALARAGARDDAHIVLYGSSPMDTGWLFMALASIGHGDHVSMLDGNIEAWRARRLPIETRTPAVGTGRLTPRAAPDVIVDAKWVRDRLQSPAVKILDVRTEQERAKGYVPGSTLVLWQDLFTDAKLATFKSKDEIRALIARSGVRADQQAVTYCAIGMRASLMYFAARYAGIPTRVYVGSWQDWSSGNNPIGRN